MKAWKVEARDNPNLWGETGSDLIKSSKLCKCDREETNGLPTGVIGGKKKAKLTRRLAELRFTLELL